MHLLQHLQNYLDEFNNLHNITLKIDTIRVDFSKRYTLPKLEKLGEWQQLQSNSNILSKLKKREDDEKITTAYRLKGYGVYYYNLQDAPKYRKARLVVFGLSQYHSDMTTKEIDNDLIDKTLKSVINSTLSKLNGVTLDVCYDMPTAPSLEQIKKHFKLYRFKDSIYINEPDIMGVEKIVIYNKQAKNTLKSILYRIEVTIRIYNLKALILPLDDVLEHIITPTRGANDKRAKKEV